jgi:hypothetical protein
MNSRFKLIKKHFPNEVGNLEEKLTEFLISHVDIKEFLALNFLEELLNERPLDVCPIEFGAKCHYFDGICDNCLGTCQYPFEIRQKFFILKTDLKFELENLYEKVKKIVQFQTFFPGVKNKK